MTIPEILYQRALEAGFTVEAACSLIANIQGEGAFRSDNAEDKIHRYGISDAEYVRRADAGLETFNGKNFIYDEVGFGYAQWTFWSRKKFLLEFCKNRGVSVSDREAQKEFIFVEMERDFPGIWKMCRTSHDLEYIMRKLIEIWENPDDHNAAMNERYPYARAWLSKFSNWSVPAENSTVAESKISEDANEIEKYWPPRMINNGLNWPETYLLQSLLRCHGYNVLVNGIFSDSLTEKVKAFQQANGLVVDGVVGPKTWKALMTLPANY